jgi:hypothetical protein
MSRPKDIHDYQKFKPDFRRYVNHKGIMFQISDEQEENYDLTRRIKYYIHTRLSIMNWDRREHN